MPTRADDLFLDAHARALAALQVTDSIPQGLSQLFNAAGDSYISAKEELAKDFGTEENQGPSAFNMDLDHNNNDDTDDADGEESECEMSSKNKVPSQNPHRSRKGS